jgi:hypothetical protein
MPSLDWIGKRAVVNHHREIPFHLVRCDKDMSKDMSAGDSSAGNLLQYLLCLAPIDSRSANERMQA